MRIGLFVTCVNDLAFPATPIAVVTLLRKLGCQVDFPEAQTCCGQMQANTGYAREAAPLIEHFVSTFDKYDAVVSPSGSCVAMVREQYPRLHSAATELAARTYELAEFLVDVLGVTDVGAKFPHRATYHPSCHGLRNLKLGDKPARLLRAVEGLELVPLPDATQCCGFGGTFALKNSPVSAAMLHDKCHAIHQTGAEYVLAGDNSCLAHIGGGLTRSSVGSRTMHYAQVLAS